MRGALKKQLDATSGLAAKVSRVPRYALAKVDFSTAQLLSARHGLPTLLVNSLAWAESHQLLPLVPRPRSCRSFPPVRDCRFHSKGYLESSGSGVFCQPHVSTSFFIRV